MNIHYLLGDRREASLFEEILYIICVQFYCVVLDNLHCIKEIVHFGSISINVNHPILLKSNSIHPNKS